MEETINANEDKKTVFVFEAADPNIVTIGISDEGKEVVDDVASVMEDLMDNINQNFKTEGYIYDVRLTDDKEGIEIRPFEDGDPFDQGVFNMIAEELDFMDSLVSDSGEFEEDLM